MSRSGIGPGTVCSIVGRKTSPSHELKNGTQVMVTERRNDNEWYIHVVGGSGSYFAVEDDLEPDNEVDLDAEMRKLLGITHCRECGREYDDEQDRPEQTA